MSKTINKIFERFEDFIASSSGRNQEILDFSSQFKELEKSNDLDGLNVMIIPKLVVCLEEVLLKPNEEQLQEASLSVFKKKLLLKIKERIEELISLFKKSSSSFEEFYGHILRGYTMNTDLNKILNDMMNKEGLIEVDKLLPYIFCFCQAFFSLKPKPNLMKEEIFNSSEEQRSIILYRGTALDEIALSLYDTKKVKCFSWTFFTSTSSNRQMAEALMYQSVDISKEKYPVMFIIEIPEQKAELEYLRYLDLREYSVKPQEEEVILPPGSIFEFLEVSRDSEIQTIIRIRLVDDLKHLS